MKVILLPRKPAQDQPAASRGRIRDATNPSNPGNAGNPTGSLAQAAYDVLHDRIVRCDLVPGQWITERQMAEEIGMGLAPVRGALARLSAAGLLLTAPRKGYQVTPLTIKSVEDLFLTWKLLGPEIMRLAVTNMTPELANRYKEVLDQARTQAQTAPDAQSASRSGRPGAPAPGQAPKDAVDVVVAVSQAQWRFFAQVAGNTYLSDLYMRLEGDLGRVYTLAYSADPQFVLTIMNDEHHSQLPLRFENSETEAALVRQFISIARERVLQVLRSTPAAMAVELVR